MDTSLNAIIWGQLGAAIDMMEDAIRACPDTVWSDNTKRPEWPSNDVVGFWYLAFHTLFFLDYYLSDSPDGFAPPPPFTLDEMDPAGLLPEHPYTKTELLNYLDHCRSKARNALQNLTEESASKPCGFERRNFTRAELLIYTMRHVQHHTAQMNLILRRETGSAPLYVGRTRGG